ncbi:hypothetical protein SEA_SPILLED_54 [Streptomyces phage Spilled]|jgi:hypothetical protein|uniref:Uncharacterized protein n=4 Tax=Streptomyces virus Karimac TaxID=2846401 RepID=A0A5Q2WQ35_9CAUD|nr:hypothetical protein [Streptomyces sp. JV178]YP_009840224.1 hypothetical protein HWB80_gp228 [Streptomyces phage Karimac]AXH66560.1 hypothetical protein SEA_STARBOW_51 [Streptomyces phage Starbow]QDF17226.1 hypothetical protein SEA_BIRCHLYN_50 [Streptomyces phage Birchlyn]QFP97366.1 hypothetical protein SEA_ICHABODCRANE_50 [Streptomyces phage IchabodCrane]QGH74297.1 hypothetical protein SEA_WIPEOUT_51 [Streptomyces phage Wipeout]QGH78938.1 hypothetical protein SEA_TOMSAWYER_51 [Streptomyce
MSYNKMKVDELRELADAYAVDVEPSDNKSVIINKLIESGVTFDYHQAQVKAAEGAEKIQPAPVFDEPAEDDGTSKILLRMTRANGTFEVRGARFTQTNPYALVAERDADYIIESYEGFRIASPREVKEFYS